MTPIQSSILDALLRHGKSNEFALRNLTGNSALTTGIALRQLESRSLVQLSGRGLYELSESGIAAMIAAMTREPEAMICPAHAPSGDSRQCTARAMD